MADKKTAGAAKLAIIVVLVLAAGVAVYLYTRLSPSIVAAVEAYGEAATGTNVSLRSAEVSLTDSRGTLSGLTVENPQGYATEYALAVDEIALDIELGSLAGNALVVNEIVVDGAVLNAEQRGGSSNLTEILEHMEQDGDAPPSDEPEDRIIIDRFRLADARVTLTSELLDGEQLVELPEVIVEGIGRDSGGVTYGEATEALLGPILAAARSAVRERLEDEAAGAVRDEIEDAVEEELRELLQ